MVQPLLKWPMTATHAGVDQALRDGDGLLPAAAVIQREGLNLLAEHAALRVPLVDGDLRAVEHARADLAVAAGQHAGQGRS